MVIDAPPQASLPRLLGGRLKNVRSQFLTRDAGRTLNVADALNRNFPPLRDGLRADANQARQFGCAADRPAGAVNGIVYKCFGHGT